MSNEPMVMEGRTKTGNLEFKLAAGACYLPVSFLHLVAAGVFLATEPKEHRFVRFHAVQSLALFAALFGGSMASILLGMMVVPIVVFGLGSVIGGVLANVSEDLAGVVFGLAGLLSAASYILGAVVGIGLSLGFLPAMGITGLMVVTGKEGRWPVLGGLVDRFV